MQLSDPIDLSKIHTYEDMVKYLPPESRYELYEGVCVKMPSTMESPTASDMSPAPYGHHQAVAGELFAFLRDYLRSLKSGMVFHAPFDVILEDKVALQPDVVVFKEEKYNLYEKQGFFGAPDLVMEVISKGTRRIDYGRKFDLYEKYGVPEYWIVEPELQSIEIHVLKESKYVLDQALASTQVAVSRILPGFSVQLEQIFNPWPRKG